MIDDAALLRRYAHERAEDAFAELVRRRLNLVYSVALRRTGGDAHLAADIAQCVFAALARRAATFSRDAVLAGWLYTTTRHIAIDTVRARQRREAREQEAHAMQQLDSSSAPHLAWEQLRPVLDDVMDDLPAHDREAVLLRFYQGRAFGEIGAVLGLGEDAARMRVDRALDKLRALLARRGVTSTSTALAVVLAEQAVSAAPAGLAATVMGTALSTGGAVAFDLFSFMTTTHVISIGAAAAVLLSIGTVVYTGQAERATASAVESAQREHLARLAQQREIEQRAKSAEAAVAQLQQSLVEARTAAANALKTAEARRTAQTVAAAPAGQTPRDQLAEGTAYLAAHPEVKQALVERSRARVASRFLPLYAALKLTPAQIEQFETLQIESEGISGNGMMLRPGTGLSRAEVEQRTRELLGEAGYLQYQEAARLIPGRVFATALGRALYFTDTPLTGQQAQQFAEIVSQLDRDRRGQTGRDWDALLEQAKSVLSAPQLSAVHAMRQHEQLNAALAQAAGRSKGP
jgi:RNA polymerase sigma factor (sigma-70 family)